MPPRWEDWSKGNGTAYIRSCGREQLVSLLRDLTEQLESQNRWLSAALTDRTADELENIYQQTTP